MICALCKGSQNLLSWTRAFRIGGNAPVAEDRAFIFNMVRPRSARARDRGNHEQHQKLGVVPSSVRRLLED